MNSKFAVITNRGSQVALESTIDAAEVEAERINDMGGDVFAWVVEVCGSAEAEDIPGRGIIYG